MSAAGMRRALGWLGRGLAIAVLLLLFWQAVIFTQIVWWSRFDPDSTRFMRKIGRAHV